MIKITSTSIFFMVLTNSILIASAIIGNVNHHHEMCKKANQWGCIGFSSGCIERKDCLILVSYQVQKESGDVTFKLHGNTTEDKYIALAISKDSKMADDGAIACYQSTSNGPGIVVTWNFQYSNDIITSYHLDHLLANPSTSYENGMLACEFTLRKEWRVPKPDKSNGVNYDLSHPYFLHLAKGSISKDRKKPWFKLDYHDQRMCTGEQIFLKETYNHETPKDYKSTLVKIHASLMVVAWMFFAEIGTFTAGYFRTRFPEDAGVYWFHIHTVTMSITWVLSVSSILVMFIGTGFDALLNAFRPNQNPHAAVGLAAIILTFIQPIMGFLRPGPYSSRRSAFKIIHTITGYLATPLSLIAILLSTTLEQAMLMKQGIVIAGCFVGLWCCGHAFLKAVKRRGLTDGVTIGYFLGIGGFFSFMIAFLIIIFIS